MYRQLFPRTICLTSCKDSGDIMKILFIKVVDRKIEIHTTNGVYHGSLNVQLDRLLSQYGFVRIDQNKYVNMDEIEYFDATTMKVKLKCGLICDLSNMSSASSRFSSSNASSFRRPRKKYCIK